MLGLIVHIVVILTIYQFQCTLSCQGRTRANKATSTIGPLFGTGKGDHNLYRGQDHWVPSEKVRLQWTEWYKKWVIEQSRLKESDQQAVEKGSPDCDNANEPQGWECLPPGRGPQEPPPWAIIPENYGKPHFCYQPPARGYCSDQLTRWGFNPYLPACQKFNYTGCGGNDNNFLSKRRCEQACQNLASSLCLNYANRKAGTILVGKLGC